MIPLRDNIAHRKFPYVNTFFIIVNVSIFIYELGLGTQMQSFFNSYAVIPSRFLATDSLTISRLTPLFTSMFLHAGLLHIAGNMLFLFIFGDNVEDSMGHFRYFIFYILAGVLAGLAHIYTNSASAIPSLGASGAISGVLGAYILLFPAARVATLIFLLFFFYVIEIPAWIFLGLWFLLQVVSGASTVGQNGAGVAFWAHIGGFVAGFILVLFFRKKRKDDFLKYF